MFARFFGRAFHQDSNAARFESASCCASFYAALLLLIDTVIAVSIFVSADFVVLLCGILVSLLLGILIVRVLLSVPAGKRSKPLAAHI
jgi:hypothetical protein